MTIEGAEFEISLNAADSSCGITNSCEGEIDLTVEGGNSPFTYYWSNGATTEDIDGLCPGTYDVSVTDAGGCTLVDTTTLVAPSPIIIGIADIGDESCGGACDGYIDIDVFGGVAPYTYVW